MTTRKIRVTAKQLDTFIRDIRAIAAEPTGDHLSDDQFISYSMEMLTARQVEQVDAHLASCSDCAIEMERLLEASEAWRGEEGEQRLAQLRLRVQTQLPPSMQPSASLTSKLWPRLADLLRRVVLLPDMSLNAPALTAQAATPWDDGQTEDGTLRWRIVKDEEGNLTVRFASHVLGEGMRLRLYAGDWHRDIVLGKVAPDQVGAETVITREERQRMPDSVELRVEPLAGDMDAGGAI